MKPSPDELRRRQALDRLGRGGVAAALMATQAAALFAPAAALRAQPRAADPALVFALSPFLSPRALLAAFEPLRQHLERELATPVRTRSARDFRSLALGTRDGAHDLAQLPAHLARLAMLDWGWTPLAGPDLAIAVVVAVREPGPVLEPAALRGRRLATLDPLSLTATVGRAWLRQQGLDNAVAIDVLPSVNSMLYALDRGDIDAFVCTDTQLAALPADTPRGERVLARLENIAGPLIVARPRLDPARLEALRRALTSFEPDRTRPPTAANVRLRVYGEDELSRLDAYAAEARRALGDAGAPKR